ncbi:MAG TPA: TIM-barrel domain-containing protein [Pyrinomonadaceae bacterium]|nr:TIM-barrel domain-containing protein [Pyrinomonadaceae bacterium]
MNADSGGRRRFVALAFVLVCIWSNDARAAWRAAGNVVAVTRQTNGVTLTLSSGARAVVTFQDLNVARVRLSPRGVFERDFSYAVAPMDRKTVAAVVREAGRDAIEITTQVAGPKIVINRRPFLVSVYDARGELVVADDPKRPAAFDLETGAVESSKRRDHLEFYYGFGEKALPTARQGHVMAMWNTDTYAYAPGLDPIYESIPFLIALRQGRAYGLFFDNTHRTYFDMGKSAPERYTFGAAGGDLNYYVFTGGAERLPKTVVADYTKLTGRTELPPVWSLGYQQSRYSYFPEARVREIARNFRERRIPADVIHLDIDYMDGFRIFTWDKTRFPDPPKMLADLRRDGFRVVVIIDPGIKVDENYAAYREGRAGGFFHRTAAGQEFHARVWPGVCAFPDYTNPQTRAWFGALYKTNLDEGISGFWNDMNEPGTFGEENQPPQPNVTHDPAKTFPLDVRHAGDGLAGNHARYHNVYGMQMARSTFEGVKKLRPEARPFVLTRAGYAGIQRFSAVWTGDNVPTWEHLQLTIPMLTNLGVSGVPFVGADIGGFAGNATPELYARWLQAGVLTPFLRTHIGNNLQDREPWSFGSEFERINRSMIELRYRLLPYLYSVFQEHTETGAPVMRPLWFEYPNDYAIYSPVPQFEEYLVGADLLVAPVLTQGDVKRPVYFPKGDAWVDWHTGTRHEGGTFAVVDAPIERLPLFVRAGAGIPMQPVIQHTGEMSRAPLSLLIATGADRTSRFYEDAGDGYEYRRGAYRRLSITQTANTIRLARTGAYNVSRPLASVELLGLAARPREVRVGSRVVQQATFDEQTKRLTLALPPENVEEITITP